MRYMMLELRRWARSHNIPLDGVRIIVEAPNRETQYAFEASIMRDTSPLDMPTIPVSMERNKGSFNGVPYEIVVKER